MSPVGQGQLVGKRVHHGVDGALDILWSGDKELKALRHYRGAKVEDTRYNIGDDVYVRAEQDEPHYIGRTTEIFEGTDHGQYFNCRWFFRPEDTVISTAKLVDDHQHDPKRVFILDERDDNPLECIISKVKIVQVDPKARHVFLLLSVCELPRGCPFACVLSIRARKR